MHDNFADRLHRAAAADSTPAMRRDSAFFLTTWAAHILKFGKDPASDADLVSAGGLSQRKAARCRDAFDRTYPAATPGVLVRESGLLAEMAAHGAEAKDVRSALGLLRRIWRQSFTRS